MNSIMQNLSELLISAALVGIFFAFLFFAVWQKAWLKRLPHLPAMFALAIMLIYACLQTFGQANIQYQYNGAAPFSQDALAYSRNLRLTTTNDSEAIIVSKPSPAGGLSNNFLDFYTGSSPTFTIGPGGSISNLSAAAQSNTLVALGIQYGSNGAVTATEDISNNFAVPFASPPTIILGHTTNTCQPLTIASNYFIITNNAGVQPITWMAIGPQTF
jgi:hypothetical protein